MVTRPFDAMTHETTPVIDINNLTRRFDSKTALASVTLSLPRGGVYGLVGTNGAGKTTLIKHILGLLKAQTGSVRVFGLDPVEDPVGVLSRIGYLSEENDLPSWMRIDELIRYSRAFHPAWDDDYAEELRQSFALDPAAKIRNLSKGQKARVGLGGGSGPSLPGGPFGGCVQCRHAGARSALARGGRTGCAHRSEGRRRSRWPV